MGAYGVKGALFGSCDEGLVVDIDVCATSMPVTRVVIPHDVAETKGLGDSTDTVVNVAIWRLSERMRKVQVQEDETHTPAGRRDADNEFNYFHL